MNIGGNEMIKEYKGRYRKSTLLIKIKKILIEINRLDEKQNLNYEQIITDCMDKDEDYLISLFINYQYIYEEIYRKIIFFNIGETRRDKYAER